MDLSFMQATLLTLLGGLPLTLNLTACSILLGGAGALVLALMRTSGVALLSAPARAYVFVFRGTPLLIQLFMIYYGLGQFRPALQELGLWSFFRDPYWCAVLAMAMNTAAYSSEIIRGGLNSVPPGALEAASACGMRPLMRLRRIVLPLAIRQALPAYGNELVLMAKATSLASTITLMEVTGLAGKMIAQTYRAVEIFACAGIIYLALTFILTRAILVLEWWLSPRRRHAQPARQKTCITGEPA
ncbi:polar amino acid transport system permease protein (plasmid) [Azospirillum sp. B510]|uniref:ABC transporter permease n=1 Tax=Azospirillum sp. (strain B510) TaxID=137722 RepID=UPI0001C4C6D0|nr:ABC transporter permease [Azospirillum sp. B510]BAI75037.1 polar amino acid transport system permease protein [Azospirillum sp. B510]